jgi:hypothetical protein
MGTNTTYLKNGANCSGMEFRKDRMLIQNCAD